MNRAIIFSATIIVALSICLIPLFNLPQQWLNLESRGLMADLIVKNGVIFTSDASLPFADSMAVLNGRILRVGNYSALKDLAGDKTRELDLEGKVVVPGFIDSHVHLIWGGLQMKRVELHGVDRKDEFVRRVKEAVRTANKYFQILKKIPGCWVVDGTMIYGEENYQWPIGLMILRHTILFG